MEDCRQRNSPDSSTNESNKPSMTNNNHISGGAASSTEVSARSSSKNLTLGYKCPKGCKTIFVDESTFAGHLLSEHNVKLVVTAPPSENQQLHEGSQTNTASSPLSSLSSPSSTPPTMSSSSTATTNVITKCPVCRLQVDDLPFHFATAHSTTNNKSPTNHDRSESANNNNVLLNRRNHNLCNGVRPSNGEHQWTTSQLSPQQIPLVVVQNDAIKSEVLSYEEMESGMEAYSVPPKSESPIKITNSTPSSSSVRKLAPPAKVMPIFLPSQPLPASQLAIEERSSISSPRGAEHSSWMKNQDVERHVRNLPMTIIPTVVGNHRPLTSSLTLNGQTNSTEALNETDGKIPSHRGNGMAGQQLSVKVEEGGAMNLSIKDSPRSDISKSNLAHVNGIPLPLLDGRAVNSGPTAALRSNPGLPYVLNTDSNVSSASLSDLESEGGQDNGIMAINGAGQQHDDVDMSTETTDKKRRRKQTSVPPGSKDQRYWARRLKNNEAAKRSRDMRIQREKIIFDENNRLESHIKELKTDQEKLTTENKELKLKMQFILEENARLQDIIRNIQVQQHEQQQLDEEMDGHTKINGQNITTNGVHYK